MKLQAVLASLFVAACLGGILLFVSGILVALAVAVPVAIVLAVVFGKATIEVRHDS